MSVEIIESKKEWDEFIDDSYNGMLFHKWDFLKIAEKHSKMKLYTYGIYKGNTLVAVLPLYVIKKGFFKIALTQPPRTAIPYSGFVLSSDFKNLKQGKKEGIMELIVTSINDILKEISPIYFFMKLTPQIYDIREFLWSNYMTIPHYTYLIDLTKDFKELWSGLMNTTRRRIKKIERAYTEIDVIKKNSGNQIYNLLKERYESQGLSSPLLNSSYINDLIKKYPNNIEVYIIKNEDNILSGKIILKYKKIYFNWIGDVKSNDPNIADYMMWKFIERAKMEGFETYDMCGADTKRLCMFKSKFNPSLAIHFNIIKKEKLIGYLVEWLYHKSKGERRWRLKR